MHVVESFDDLIGPQQQRGRDGETERFGSFEVDDELVLGSLLDWQMFSLAPNISAKRCFSESSAMTVRGSA